MMYVRYPLSLRNLEDLLAERGIDISHETVRFWWNRFGPMFATEIRKNRVAHLRGFPQWRWHLDEVFVKINGKLRYLWRAVDHEGEVLEAVVTTKRNKAAALKLLKRIMKKCDSPCCVVTDGCGAYSAAMKEIGAVDRHEVGRRLNNRAENSHQPFRRRERAMQRFRSMKTLQKFSSVHAQVHNHFDQERHLSRPASLQAETLCYLGRVASPLGLNVCPRGGVSRHAHTTTRYFDKAVQRPKLDPAMKPRGASLLLTAHRIKVKLRCLMRSPPPARTHSPRRCRRGRRRQSRNESMRVGGGHRSHGYAASWRSPDPRQENFCR